MFAGLTHFTGHFADRFPETVPWKGGPILQHEVTGDSETDSRLHWLTHAADSLCSCKQKHFPVCTLSASWQSSTETDCKCNRCRRVYSLSLCPCPCIRLCALHIFVHPRQEGGEGKRDEGPVILQCEKDEGKTAGNHSGKYCVCVCVSLSDTCGRGMT